MNHMKEIAHMLGVELGERFKISGADGEFWLDDNGLHMLDDKGDYDLNALLVALLTGRWKIEWLPLDGECYWFVDPYGDVLGDQFDYDNVGCLLTVKSGRIYRTEAEARDHAEEDKAFWESIRKGLLK